MFDDNIWECDRIARFSGIIGFIRRLEQVNVVAKVSLRHL